MACATIKIQARKLAEISEKSPGYSVFVRGEDGTITELTAIRFNRHTRSGRRDKSVVRANYTFEGTTRYGAFDSDTVFALVD